MVLEKNVTNKMDRISSDEGFQRAKEERLLLKILKNGLHSWIGHIIRHKEFVVNIREGAIPKKKMPWEDLYYNTYSNSPETQGLTGIQL
jgi:hypothetical protein